MKTFTLQQIAEVLDYRHALSRERFFYYFGHLYGFDGERIERYWEVFNRFPGVLRCPDFHELLEDLIEKAAEIIRLLGLNESVPYRVRQQTKPLRKRIHYRRKADGEVAVVEVDFNEPSEVIVYADLLRAGCEVVAATDFVEQIPSGKAGGPAGRQGYVDVFDGDIFATYEERIWSRGREDTLYVCDKGVYRRLLYTAGKGYLRKGVPDYDTDNAYNAHVLTLCRNFTRIGNIYVDCSMLEDKAEEDGRNPEAPRSDRYIQ